MPFGYPTSMVVSFVTATAGLQIKMKSESSEEMKAGFD